ncbi:MAG: hypothetical protein V7K28_09440 [Nostoc sp.]
MYKTQILSMHRLALRMQRSPWEYIDLQKLTPPPQSSLPKSWRVF